MLSRKISALFLAICLILSCIPFGVKNVEASSKAKLKSINVSLKEGNSCRKSGNTYYLVKGTKQKLVITQTLTKKAKAKYSKSYSSSAKKKVYVTKSGQIQAKKEGKATIKTTVKTKKTRTVSKSQKTKKINVVVMSRNAFDKKFKAVPVTPVPQPSNPTSPIDGGNTQPGTPVTPGTGTGGTPSGNTEVTTPTEPTGQNNPTTTTEGNQEDVDTPSDSGQGSTTEPSNPGNQGESTNPSQPQDSGNNNPGQSGDVTEPTNPTTDPVTEDPVDDGFRYSYSIHFFAPPITNFAIPIFIETDNPDRETFSLSFSHIDGSGKAKDCFAADPQKRYLDLPSYEGYVVNLPWRVDGGYVINEKFTGFGNWTVSVNEYPEGTTLSKQYSSLKETKVLGSFTVINSKEKGERWRNEIIEKATTDDMTPKEKMDAICIYLQQTQRYLKNYHDENGETQLLDLITDAGYPAWDTGEWDSLAAPTELVEIGKMIGYPVRSMFYDYPVGSANWERYHAYVINEDDGCKYTFRLFFSTNFYPDIHSRDDVEKVDCLHYDKYYEITPAESEL